MGQPVRVQVPPSANDGLPGTQEPVLLFLLRDRGRPSRRIAPVSEAHRRYQVEGHKWEDPVERSLPHVIIVDDNSEFLEMLSELLEEAGYRVTACSSGLGCLLRIGADRPDAVVLDLKLNDISGFDIYRALRADPGFQTLPVLFVSGVFLDEALLRDRVGDPNARLLLKPVPKESILAEIEAARAGSLRAPSAA